MSTLTHDLKSAVRLLVKNPGFTLIVVITLALGIGLNSAVFSAVDALLLRPLPGVQAADELVQVYRTWPGGMNFGSNSFPHVRDLRNRTGEVFSGVASWHFNTMNLSVGGQPRRMIGVLASANYFSVLGVNPLLGRTFVPAEDTGRRAHPVVVLSHSGWRRIFAGDPHVVGKTLLLNGETYTVIGVTPESFKGSLPVITPLLWAPETQIEQLEPGFNDFEQRGNNNLQVIARLRPGATVEGARARMSSLLGELRREYPDAYRDGGINLVPQSEAGIHPMIRGAQVGLTSVIMGVVLMLLLIACVNVANLMLARARDRSREMAVRLSIGARRSVLVRQLLTESLLLASVAGAAGLLLAWWAIRLANGVHISVISDVELSANLELNPKVLLFTLGVSLLTGILFGLAPALQATRPDLVRALKGEAPAGGSKHRLTRGLVVAQMALSIVLLVSAGLFLRNLEAATRIDKGFVSDNVLTAEVDPGMQGYSRARTEEFYRRIEERVAALPNVKAVGLANRLPLALNMSDWGVSIPGYTPAPNENMSISIAIVAPGYFAAVGTPLLKGREFTVHDDSLAQDAIVVNQRFVDRFWAGQDPIGKIVKVGSGEHTVIGVTPTGKYLRLGEEPTAYMYLAQAQHWESGMNFVIRTSGDPAAVTPVLRAEVQAFDPDLPLSNIRTMNNFLGLAYLPARLAAAVLGLFGFLGLVLASLGVYGVMSHSVAQRHREIGIRVAIGAATSGVVSLLMGEGFRLVGLGIVIGLGGALAGARLLRGLLYGSGFDPVTFVAVPLILGAIALLAIWIPARRAASVNPIVVLRQE
jgi:predicted permease